MQSIFVAKGVIFMTCAYCGKTASPNKGWASVFYPAYCNHCDRLLSEEEVSDDDGETVKEVDTTH